MPNWKKLIVSGSDATLNSLNVNTTGAFGDDVTLTSGSFRLETFNESFAFYNGSNYTTNRINLTTAQNMQFRVGGAFQFTGGNIQILSSNELQLQNATNNGKIRFDNIGGDGEEELNIKNDSGTSLLKISGSGNVGIGTAPSTHKLEVNGSVKGNDIFGNLFSVANEGKVVSTSTLGLQLQATAADKPITFSTNVSGMTERMRITHDGKVGIGTNNPNTNFHVSGEQLIKKVDTSTAHHGTLNIKANTVASLSNHARSAFINLQGSAVSSNSVTNYDFVLGTHHSGDFIIARDSSFAGGYDSGSLKIDKDDLTVTVENKLVVNDETNIGGQLFVKNDSGLQISDTADSSTSKTTFTSFNQGGNSRLKIKGGNFIHSLFLHTNKNDFKYAALSSSHNGTDTNFQLFKSNSDTTGTAATTTISTGTSTFAGDVNISTGKHLFFDGGNSGTYITEDIADRLRIFVGATEFIRLTESTNDTISIFKDTSFGGDILLGDGQKAKFGDNPDLQIYHNGSHSFIQDVGAGDLRLLGSSIKLQSSGEENMLVATPDAGVFLYYDNAVKFETYAAGVGITGNAYLTSGNHIHFDNGVSNNYYLRKTGTTLEFKTGGTYNFLSGNAAFAGDINTSGNIYLNNNKTIFGKNTSGSNYGLLTITSGNVVKLGAYAYTSAATQIGLGDNGKFLIGTAEALSIDSSKNATFAGDVTVAGTLTAQEFKTELVSASIVFESGSSLFGNSIDDTHSFTGSMDFLFDTSAGNRTFILDGSKGPRLQRFGDTAGWAMEYGFNANDGTNGGGFGGYGDSTGLTYYYIGTAYNNNTVVIKPSSGRVGIGTTSPEDTLDIESNLPTIRLTDTDNSTFHRIRGNASNLVFQADEGNAAASSKIKFEIDGSQVLMLGHTGLVTLDGYGSGNHTGTLAKSLGVDSSGNIIEFTGGSGGGTVSSITSGADNRIAIFNGTDSLEGDADLVFDGSKLGIGLSSPTHHLTVIGDATNVVAKFQSTDNQAWISVHDDDSGTYGALFGTDTDAGHDIVLANHSATKRLVIDSSGNVGIGTTSPAVTLHVDGFARLNGGLQLNQAGAVQIYQIQNNALRFGTNNTERMRILADGKVGIGTTAPGEQLEVSGSILITDIGTTRGIRRNNDAYDLRLMGGTSLTDGAYISLGGDLRGGAGTALAGKVEITQGGAAYASRAAISSSIAFNAVHNGGTVTDMSIDGSTGNVGIGNTSPSQKLSVTGNIGLSGVVLFDDNNGINFGDSNAKIYGSSADGIKFNAGGSEAMRLNQSGNIGIGTTAPTRTLHVVTTADQIAKFESSDASAKIEVADNTTAAYINANSTNASFGPFSSYSSTGNIRIASGSEIHTGEGFGAFGATPVDNTKWKVAATVDTSADHSFNNTLIDLNVQGSSALTGDKTYRGLYIDLDNNASGGDTTNEVRLYGGYIATQDNQDADLHYGLEVFAQNSNATAGVQMANVLGIKGTAKAQNTDGLVQNLIGVDGTSNLGSATGGDITTAYGVRGQVMGGASDKTPNNIFGVYGRTDTGANFNSTITSAHGVYGEIEQDGNSTINNAYAGRFEIDINSGSVIDSYQFLGNTSVHANATGITNANYGIVSRNAARHFLQGKTLIGSSHAGAPGAELHIYSTGSGLVGISIQNSSTSFDSNTSSDGLSIGVNGNDAYFVNRESADIYINTNSQNTNGITIKSGGNIGLGTVNPGYQLDVAGDINTSTGLIRRGGNAIIKSSGAETMIGPGGSGVITFHNSATMTSSDEKVRIDANGNLLLNNTSANARLDIREDSNYALRLEDASGHYFRVNTGGDTEIRGNVTVGGTITAQEFHTELVSASIVFESGSTIFGNSSDDTHDFTGSVNIKDGDILVTTTGGYFQVDTSDNSAKHADNTKAKFGTGNDFQIWHDGSNTYLSNEGVGDLNIQNTATDKDINFKADNGSGGTTTYLGLDGSDTMMKAHKNLRFLDSVKATFGNGDDFTIHHNGTVSAINNAVGHLQIYQNADDKNIEFYSDDASGGVTRYFFIDGQNKRVKAQEVFTITDSSSLRIGNNEHGQLLVESGNTLLKQLNSGNIVIRQEVDDADIKFLCDNGSGGTTEYFRLDGGDARMYASREIRFVDGVASKYGNSGDLGIYHNGTNSYIENITGTLFITSFSLSGTGRIQGIDTVTDSTDAASKGYVDTQISNINSSNIDGSGTATYLAKFSDSNTLTSSGMFQAASNNFSIGGVTTPNARLSVEGSISVGTTSTDVLKLHNESGVGTIDGYSTRNIAFGSVTNGEVMRIDNANGRVGIGTTSPTQTLDVDGAIITEDYRSASTFYLTSGDDWRFRSDTGSERMRITSAGNIGIGTTNPSGKLDVQSSANSAQLVRFWNNASGASAHSVVRIASNANNANSTRLEFSDSQYYHGTISSDRSQGIVFRTSATGTNPVTIPERMRIDSSGLVGIGTTTAGARLHVKHGTTGIIGRFEGATGRYIYTGTDGAGHYIEQVGTEAANRKLRIQTSDGSGGYTQLFLDGANGRIYTPGDTVKVGVGTTAPSAKFNVQGSATIGWGNLGNALILAGTTSSGIGIDTNEIANKGDHLYVGTIDAKNIVFRTNGANARLTIASNGTSTFTGNVITNGGLTVGDSNADTAQIGLKHLLGYCENTDVDTGTEDIKSLPLATYQAVFFDYVVKNGTNLRAGTVTAVHDGTNVEFTDTSTKDLGDTSGVTLSVDISGSNMRLRATTTSDNWTVKANIRGIKV